MTKEKNKNVQEGEQGKFIYKPFDPTNSVTSYAGISDIETKESNIALLELSRGTTEYSQPHSINSQDFLESSGYQAQDGMSSPLNPSDIFYPLAKVIVVKDGEEEVKLAGELPIKMCGFWTISSDAS